MGCNLSYMRRRMQLSAQPHKAKASGAVATFRTNLAAKLDSLFVDVTPVQDLHGQQYPYPAGGGKNKLNIDTVTWGKSINASGQIVDAANFGYSEQIPVDEGATYTFGFTSDVATSSVRRIHGWDVNGAWVEQLANDTTTAKGRFDLSATIPSGVKFITVNIRATDLECQVEKGTATTYAPYSNICPITGWAAAKVTRDGVNLFDPDSTSKEWVETNRVLGTRSGAKSNRIPCSEGMVFTLSQKNNATTQNVVLISFLDKNNTVLSRKTIANGELAITYTAPAGASVCLVGFLRWELTDEQQLEIGSTATAYTPYVGTTAVIQFGQTLYGARIDWNGRKAVAETYMVSTTWGALTNATEYTDNIRKRFNIVTPDDKTKRGLALCNVAPTKLSGIGYDLVQMIVNTNEYIYLTLPKGTPDSTEVQIMYYLATPVEIPLDLVDFVTVPGINNVFADCGNVDLSYWTNV